MIVSTQAEQAASVSYLYYLTRITDTDKSGFLWICGVLTLVYPILAIATRLILHFRDLRGGDLVCFFAAVLAIIEHALLFASLHAGFGNTDTASVVSFSLSNTGKLVQATMIILTLAYGLIKLSMAIAVGSAFASNSRHHQFASCAMIAMASFWTVLALMFLYMDCPMYSDEPNILSCSTKALEWWVVSLLDALSEIYIVLYAMIFIRVMPLPKMTKVIASMLVLPRLVLVATTIVTSLSVAKVTPYRALGSPLFLQVFVMQISLALSFATVSLPSFRVALKAFRHGSGPSSPS